MNKDKFSKLTEKEKLNRVLDGTAYWAFISKPKVSEKYKTTTYTINLGLDEANQKLAISYGLKIKPADKGTPMPYVVINRKVQPGKTPEQVKPSLVDKSQAPLKDGTLIGNESKVRVKFGTYWYDNQGGGIGTSLFKVQVLTLVEFDRSKDRSLVYEAPAAAGPEMEDSLDFDTDEVEVA